MRRRRTSGQLFLRLLVSDKYDLAARLLDLRGRRLRECVSGDGDRLRQLARAEDLDAVEATSDEAVCEERVLVHRGARGEDLEVTHVHLGGDLREGVAEAPLG